MPTITRWFRVTHDINSDPEVWELTDQCGDKALRVWLECLSIADRNSGVIGPNGDQLCRILATKCRLRANKVATILQLSCNKGWTKLDESGHLIVVKWRKYNKTRESDESLSPPSPTPPPTPKHLKSPPEEPSADSKSQKTGLDPEVKKWADLIYRGNPKRYARLITWIKAALRNYSPAVVATTLEKFSSHASDDNLGNWWPYLDKILDKQEGLKNARNNEIESARIKREEKDFFSV